ncbi:type IV secretion system DNA-binding domain-containing protein [Dyella agri]|uniref:Type IV secretion system DNA-binding domain-containing protein n=1 Tax=Dyella agri TaxID=1926869 RepID=A0ABW8KKB2_9GAMM
MQRRNRSDLTVGIQSIRARVWNAGKNCMALLIIWLVVWLTIWWTFAKADTTQGERYATGKWAQSCVLARALFFSPHFKIAYVADRPYQIDAHALCEWPELAEVASGTWVKVRRRMDLSAYASTVIVALLALGIRILGARLRGDHILRGGELVHSKDLRLELRRRRMASTLLRIGDVPLVAGSETQHVALLGTTGTGKTVLLHSLLDQMGRAAPLVVYDTKGDLLAVHCDPTRDVILNPLDLRCPAWTPWNEIETPADAWLVAEAWLPVRASAQDPFWSEASRQLFADILTCAPVDTRTNAELFRLCTQATNEELRRLLAGTPSGRLFADDAAERMRESVRSTLAMGLRALQFLDSSARAGDGFSMRRFVRNAVAEGSGCRVFLGCPPQQAAAITPLIAVLIESAAAALMALGPNRDRRVGFIVDEFPTLPPMSYVQRLMAEGRAYGAMVMLAAQTHAQIRKTYGTESADTITSLCSTHVVFRINDPESAERASKLFGEAEYDESRESDTHGKSGATANLGSNRVIRRAVLASEVLTLPNLYCYVKLSGDLPVTLVQLKPHDRPEVTAPLQARPNDQTVYRPGLTQLTAAEEVHIEADRGLL